MKIFSKASVALIPILLFPILIASCAQSTSLYGEDFTSDSKVVPAAEAITNESLHNKEVVVEGTISDVCTKKGCWLVLSDGDQKMRITFKDYGFFVPKDSFNRRAIVRGTISTETIDEETARHYASESEGEDPDKIDGPQKVITMVATGVKIAE